MLSPMNPTGLGAAPGKGFFGSNSPGSGAQTGGYNEALQQLQKGLNTSQNTTQAGQMQLGQQLQQQQGALQQNMMSRGLANTSAALNMNQAPIQSYNLGMAQLNDLSALRQMGAYQNLAGMFAQGGNQITQTAQPYAQTNYQMQLQNMSRQQQPATLQSMMGSQYNPSSPNPWQNPNANPFNGVQVQQALQDASAPPGTAARYFSRDLLSALGAA